MSEPTQLKIILYCLHKSHTFTSTVWNMIQQLYTCILLASVQDKQANSFEDDQSLLQTSIISFSTRWAGWHPLYKDDRAVTVEDDQSVLHRSLISFSTRWVGQRHWRWSRRWWQWSCWSSRALSSSSSLARARSSSTLTSSVLRRSITQVWMLLCSCGHWFFIL